MPRKKNPTSSAYFNPFPSRLRQLMEENKETQDDVAKAINMTRQAVSYYASGESNPPYDIALLIAEHFHVSLDWITGRNDATRKIEPSLQSACEYTHLPEEIIEKIANMNFMNRDSFVRIMQSDEVEKSLSSITRAFFCLDMSSLSKIHKSPGNHYYFSPDPNEEFSCICDLATKIDCYPIFIHEAFSFFIKDAFDKWGYSIEKQYEDYLDSSYEYWKQNTVEQDLIDKEAQKKEDEADGDDNRKKE